MLVSKQSAMRAESSEETLSESVIALTEQSIVDYIHYFPSALPFSHHGTSCCTVL